MNQLQAVLLGVLPPDLISHRFLQHRPLKHGPNIQPLLCSPLTVALTQLRPVEFTVRRPLRPPPPPHERRRFSASPAAILGGERLSEFKLCRL